MTNPLAMFAQIAPMAATYPEATICLSVALLGGGFAAGRFFHHGAIGNRDSQIATLNDRIKLGEERLTAAREQISLPPVPVEHPKRPRAARAPKSTPAEPEPVTADLDRVAEDVRQGTALASLLRYYILSHDGISPEMMAGLELPPVEWMNERLAEAGENWRVKSADGRNAQTYRLPASPIGQ